MEVDCASSYGAVSTGTTIMAVAYDGGVVLGADTRVTTGTYISNRASEKITALTDFAYLCRSGSAADTQTVSTYAQYYLSQHQMELGKPTDVKTVANVVKQISYHNKNMLSAGMIVGGWDQYDGASVYALPQGGTLLKAPFAIGGSGSSYLFAFCDATFKEGMSKEEAEAYVVKAVSLAMARDGASGGCVRTVTIDKEGATKKFHPGDKLELFWDEMPAQESFLKPLVPASS